MLLNIELEFNRMSAKFIGSATVLMVHDVESIVLYYRDKLGFHFNRFWGDPPSFCILHRDAHSIMLSKVESDSLLTPNNNLTLDFWDIYFWTDDVRALREEYITKGAELYHPLTEKGYGVLEFEVKDINGYIIAFGEELPEPIH